MFAEDGFTLLNEGKPEDKPDDIEDVDINIKINLEEIVENNIHLVGKVSFVIVKKF